MEVIICAASLIVIGVQDKFCFIKESYLFSLLTDNAIRKMDCLVRNAMRFNPAWLTTLYMEVPQSMNLCGFQLIFRKSSRRTLGYFDQNHANELLHNLGFISLPLQFFERRVHYNILFKRKMVLVFCQAGIFGEDSRGTNKSRRLNHLFSLLS